MYSPKQVVYTIPSETLWKRGQKEYKSQTVRRAAYCHLLGKTQSLPTRTQQLRMPCVESAQECVHQEWLKEGLKPSYHTPMNYFILMNLGSREIIVSSKSYLVESLNSIETPRHDRLLVPLHKLMTKPHCWRQHSSAHCQAGAYLKPSSPKTSSVLLEGSLYATEGEV